MKTYIIILKYMVYNPQFIRAVKLWSSDTVNFPPSPSPDLRPSCHTIVLEYR